MTDSADWIMGSFGKPIKVGGSAHKKWLLRTAQEQQPQPAPVGMGATAIGVPDAEEPQLKKMKKSPKKILPLSELASKLPLSQPTLKRQRAVYESMSDDDLPSYEDMQIQMEDTTQQDDAEDSEEEQEAAEEEDEIDAPEEDEPEASGSENDIDKEEAEYWRTYTKNIFIDENQHKLGQAFQSLNETAFAKYVEQMLFDTIDAQ